MSRFLDAAKASQDLLAALEDEDQQQPRSGSDSSQDKSGKDVPVLVSGAGHDALAMADLTKVTTTAVPQLQAGLRVGNCYG